jgi:hypothetical protein
MDRCARANALVRSLLSVSDGELRAAYMASVVREEATEDLAAVLDLVCERAEQAEVAAREALVAIVDALNAEGMGLVVQALREQAEGESLLALQRLIRYPGAVAASELRVVAGQVLSKEGRPLTLGERKSLARRPDRDTLQRLFGDPHPEVMRRLLRNPRLTEDDVVRLAARRPGRAEQLAEIAREPRWAHRPRVRMALVMNPATPPEMASRIAGLLLRPELAFVARSPGVPAAIRAICVEHLERRPPARAHGGHGAVH